MLHHDVPREDADVQGQPFVDMDENVTPAELRENIRFYLAAGLLLGIVTFSLIFRSEIEDALEEAPRWITFPLGERVPDRTQNSPDYFNTVIQQFSISPGETLDCYSAEYMKSFLEDLEKLDVKRVFGITVQANDKGPSGVDREVFLLISPECFETIPDKKALLISFGSFYLGPDGKFKGAGSAPPMFLFSEKLDLEKRDNVYYIPLVPARPEIGVLVNIPDNQGSGSGHIDYAINPAIDEIADFSNPDEIQTALLELRRTINEAHRPKPNTKELRKRGQPEFDADHRYDVNIMFDRKFTNPEGDPSSTKRGRGPAPQKLQTSATTMQRGPNQYVNG